MSTLAQYRPTPLTQEDGAAATLHVVFKIDGTDYVLPTETVLQIESFTGATAVPGAPPFVAGIVQIRGKVVPLVDLRKRFGHPSIEANVDTRIVVGQHGERVVGLLVDSAREVLKIPRADLKAPPSLLEHEAGGFVKAVAQVGPRLLMLLDFAKLIGEELVDVE